MRIYNVSGKVVFCNEFVITKIAFKWSYVCVKCQIMFLHVTSICKGLATSFAFRWILRTIFMQSFYVFPQHSPCEILVQDMESSRGFPLTPGRWVHMWLKNDEIEMFCPQYLTNKFSKTKIVPLGPNFNTNIFNLLVCILMQYEILGIWN